MAQNYGIDNGQGILPNAFLTRKTTGRECKA